MKRRVGNPTHGVVKGAKDFNSSPYSIKQYITVDNSFILLYTVYS